MVLHSQTNSNLENKGPSVANTITPIETVPKSTLKHKDLRPETLQLQKLQKLMNNSPKGTQIKALQTMANQNSAKKPEYQTVQSMESAIPKSPKDNVESAGSKRQYDALTTQSKPAPAVPIQNQPNNTKVAQLLTIKNEIFEPDNGRTGSSTIVIGLDGNLAPTNKPTVDPLGAPTRGEMQQGLGLHGNEPFACHLINARLGGAGHKAGNLAWGTSKMNRNHVNHWETDRKNEAQDASNIGGELTMMVTAQYMDNNDPSSPSYYLLEELLCQHILSIPNTPKEQNHLWVNSGNMDIEDADGEYVDNGDSYDSSSD